MSSASTLHREPWDRQKGESRQAFQAFQAYRDMGATRSSQRVAEQLSKSWALIRRWSAQWNWVHRTDQFDSYQDRQLQLETARARKEMAERHARMAVQGLNAVIRRLVGTDGPQSVQALDPNTLSAADVARLTDVFVKVERLARGEPTEQREVTGFQRGPIQLQGRTSKEIWEEKLALLRERVKADPDSGNGHYPERLDPEG